MHAWRRFPFLDPKLPAELLPAARRHFKATIARAEGRIGTGFIGTPALLPALVKIGEPELAAAVFLQEDFNFKTSQELIDAGWDLNKNEFAKETGTDFGIASFPFNPLDFPSRKQPGAGFKDPNTGSKLCQIASASVESAS
mgnify:CR=1 FL=1